MEILADFLAPLPLALIIDILALYKYRIQEISSTVRTLFTNVGMFITAKGLGPSSGWSLHVSVMLHNITIYKVYAPTFTHEDNEEVLPTRQDCKDSAEKGHPYCTR